MSKELDPKLIANYDFLTRKGVLAVTGAWQRTIEERDEAREIARELAAFIKTHVTRYPLYRAEAVAWYAIRPGVRRWLEE